MKVIAFVVFSLLFLQAIYALDNKLVETYLGFGYPRQANGSPSYALPPAADQVPVLNTPARDWETFITTYEANGFIAATWKSGDAVQKVDTMKIYLDYVPPTRQSYIQCFPRVRQMTYDSVLTDEAQVMAAPRTLTGASDRWGMFGFLTDGGAINKGWFTYRFDKDWTIGSKATAENKPFEVSVVDIICIGDVSNYNQINMMADRRVDSRLEVSGVLNYNWTYSASWDASPDNQLSAGRPVAGANSVLYHLFSNPVHYVGGFPRQASNVNAPDYRSYSAAEPNTRAYSAYNHYIVAGTWTEGQPHTLLKSVDVYLTNVPAGSTQCYLFHSDVNFHIIPANKAAIPTTGTTSYSLSGSLNGRQVYSSVLPAFNVTGSGWYNVRLDNLFPTQFIIGNNAGIGPFDLTYFSVQCGETAEVSFVADLANEEPNHPWGGLLRPIEGGPSLRWTPVPETKAAYYHLQGQTYLGHAFAPIPDQQQPGGPDYEGVRCNTQQCCESYQRPNTDTGNGYWELSTLCSSYTGGLHCVQETGCNLCYDPTAPLAVNLANRPVCSRFLPAGSCGSPQCCRMMQIPNPSTGNGYLQYDPTCLSNSGQHCVGRTGCKLCYVPTIDANGVPTTNVGNRPVCQEFQS